MSDEIEELQQRTRLLAADRRANIEKLEAKKSWNKAEMKRLREENVEHRRKLNEAQKNSGVGPKEKTEIERLEREVRKQRKLQDDSRARSKKVRRRLQQLKDEARELEMQARPLNGKETAANLKIRSLENKLEKVIINHNEVQSICKNYLRIEKRLEEERFGFEKQLTALERVSSAKKQDCKELTLLSEDAVQARNTVLTELESIRARYKEEKDLREKELQRWRCMVQLQLKQLRRVEKQGEERQLNANTVKEKGQHGSGGELDLLSPEGKSKDCMAKNILQQEKDQYSSCTHPTWKNAYDKVTERLGINGVNDAARKVASQESTTASLMQLSEENQAKLGVAHSLNSELHSRVEDVKYSGGSWENNHSETVDSQEKLLKEGTLQLGLWKAKYEHLYKQLISYKAGVEHIMDLLQVVANDEGIRLASSPGESPSDSLKAVNQVLTAMMNRLQPVQNATLGEKLFS